MSRVARILVLACSLTLAFPQGWCCVFAGQLARLTASATPAKPGDCCECRHQPSVPSDKPNHLPPDRCPCSDRQTVLAQQAPADHGHADLAIVALASPDLSPTLAGIDAESVCVVHPPTKQLHVFKCVWRC
jgi:hypothetical protein